MVFYHGQMFVACLANFPKTVFKTNSYYNSRIYFSSHQARLTGNTLKTLKPYDIFQGAQDIVQDCDLLYKTSMMESRMKKAKRRKIIV